MNHKAEQHMRMVRRSLREAAERERAGDHATAAVCGEYAAHRLEQALRHDGNVIYHTFRKDQ